MFTIWKQIKVLSLIIHGLTVLEYSLSSADSRNLVEGCFSDPEKCSSVNDKVICYRLCSYDGQSWNDAQRICAKNDSTLPVIRNKEEQESLESYMKSRMRISVVWTSGRNVIHGQWTWLDGQPFRARVSWEDGSSNSDYKTQTHAMLKKDKVFKQEHPIHSSWYMCQYRGISCDREEEIINLTSSCVVLSTEDTSWYGARNVCLDGGGDLAVLRDEDLMILKDHPTAFIRPNNEGIKHYWIGLEKMSWQWKFLNKKPEVVKYSKWSRTEFLQDSDLCISVQASNGEWRASKCGDSYSVICQTAWTKSDPPYVNSASVMYALIGGGVLLIFICTIIIFLLIRRRLKGANFREMRSSKDNAMQSNNGSDLEEEPTERTPETNTTSEDETLAVYAEISSAKNSNKNLENAPINLHPPSGTVYASLKFKKDTIFAEPVRKSKTANVQTQKVGPLGDIYAVPTPKNKAEVGAPKDKNFNNGKIYENLGNSN